MDWKLTTRAFGDLTDGTFTRSQVERILNALDRLAGEANPIAAWNVCPLRFTDEQCYRLKIVDDVVSARVCFEVWEDKKIIAVWGVFKRCENTYIWAEIRHNLQEAIR